MTTAEYVCALLNEADGGINQARVSDLARLLKQLEGALFPGNLNRENAAG